MTTPSWDDAYSGSTPAAWDIGRPQPDFVRLAEQGLLAFHVFDDENRARYVTSLASVLRQARSARTAVW